MIKDITLILLFSAVKRSRQRKHEKLQLWDIHRRTSTAAPRKHSHLDHVGQLRKLERCQRRVKPGHAITRLFLMFRRWRLLTRVFHIFPRLSVPLMEYVFRRTQKVFQPLPEKQPARPVWLVNHDFNTVQTLGRTLVICGCYGAYGRSSQRTSTSCTCCTRRIPYTYYSTSA